MRLAFLLALPLLFVVASAQDAAKAPFEWNTSGDSVETFKMQLVQRHKPDQSSAVAVVETYAAYSDNRRATADMMKAVGARWDAAVARSLEKHEAELLTPEAIKALRAAPGRDAAAERTRHATAIAGQSTAEDVTLVETTQTVEVPYKELGTGKVLVQKQEVRQRFACVRGSDGKWRVRGIELQTVDEQGKPKDGKAPMKWVADTGMLVFILYAAKLDEAGAEIPSVRNDTPQDAAMSLFDSLIPRRDRLSQSVSARGLDDWLAVLKPLFTPEFVEANEMLAAQWIRETPAEPRREVDKTTEQADGSRVVRFKPRDMFTGAMEVRVTRAGDKWQVAAAGYFESDRDDKGKPTWTYKAEPNLYNLKWR